MSANIEASLTLQISQMQAALAKARGEITRIKEHAKKEGAGLGQNLFKGILVIGGTGALIAAGNAALGTVTKMDRMNRAMLSLEGSAQRADARLAELRETSKLPGIGFEQAVAGDLRLRVVGLSADESKRALVEFGNALALAGGTASDLDGVILALGQIASKGKVSAEEINQIAERVPQVRAVMKDVFGTADTEVLQKMEMSAEQFISRLIDGFGLLQRASAGLDEKLNDAQQSINAMINDAAGPVVNELVPAFAELASSLAANKDAFVVLGQTAVTALGGIAEALGVLNDVGSGIGEGIGKMLGFGDVSPTSTTAVNQRAQDQATADQALAQHGPAKQYDATGKVIVPQASGEPNGKKRELAPPPEIVDKSAAAKKLREEEQARKALMEEQKRLARLQLDDYLAILPPSLKLVEVQRQMLALRENIEGLPMHEIDKLKMQQELVRWQAEERSVKADIAEETKRATEEARKAAEESAAQTQASGDFDAEMSIIEAKLKGNRDLADELQRQYDIEQLKRQIMEQQGVAADDALSKATARVDAERKLNDEIAKSRNRYDAEGRREDGRKQIKGYSAEQRGTADEARARAEQRMGDSRTRLQKDYERAFPGLDGSGASAGPGIVKDQAQQNQQRQNAASASDPSSQLGQQILVLIQQIVTAVQ